MMASNTFLIQCTFCFWLSEAVGLKANTAQDLVNNLKDDETNAIQALRTEVKGLVKNYRKEPEGYHAYGTMGLGSRPGSIKGGYKTRYKKKPRANNNIDSLITGDKI